MANSDDDSYSESSDDAKLPAQDDSKDNDEEGEPLEMRRSAQKQARCPDLAQPTRLPNTMKRLKPMLSHISKRLKGSAVDSSLSLRVIGAALQLKIDYVLKLKKASTKKKKTIPKPNIRETVCRFFRIAPRTYSIIIQEYLSIKSGELTIYTTGSEGKGRGGNTLAKDTRIPRTEELRIKVRNYVRSH